VIDGGVDIDHEDLQGKIWVNEDEIPGNNIDDDNNGYIDDVHGWNFIGNKNGENLHYENYEFTRIYKAGSGPFYEQAKKLHEEAIAKRTQEKASIARFETLYYDARNDGMIMVCKQCADDKGKGYNTAYRFDMKTWEFDEAPFYRINIADIERLTGEDISLFKPSAAAIHPFEKRLYMLSAVNRLLVITDLDGKVQEAYNLKHTLFRQPEGISFAVNGDMYISNESADESSANILKFKYNQRPL